MLIPRAGRICYAITLLVKGVGEDLVCSGFMSMMISILLFLGQGGQSEKRFKHPSSTTECKFKKKVSNFVSAVDVRWKKTNRHHQRFLSDYEDWLQEDALDLSEIFEEERRATTSSGGRPPVDFDDLSESSKRRKTASLRAQVPAQELAYATQMSLRESGHTEASKALHSAVFKSDCDPSSHTKPAAVNFTSDESLALISQAKLTKDQYLYIRRKLKEHNVDVLPAYEHIIEAKNRCYPSQESMVVSEAEATVNVQALFDLTAQRLIEANKEIFVNRPNEKELVMLWKWGFDGSTAHSEYKQRSEGPLQEGSIILNAAVPLQIYSQPEAAASPKLLFWQNPRPSSTRFCRPIQLLYSKETKIITKDIHSSINSQIAALNPCSVSIENLSLKITHRAILSMIDGKVASVIQESATQNCGVCGATPKLMNKIDEVLERPLNKDALDMGISVLHAWIRFLELCLHVAYRLTIKASHRKYTDKEKEKINEQQILIREKLKGGLGLTVDKPKPGGFGNTNDGNTARRFFENPEQTSTLTGLNMNLLKRIRVILSTISTGFAIDVECFRYYCVETARLFTNEYKWYPMSVTAHKVLIHGADFVKNSPIPIGLLSEKALEARHKDIRYFRTHHTRLCSRKDGNQDLINILLISSDPLICSFKPKPKRKSLVLCSDVLSLLRDPLLSESHYANQLNVCESEDELDY